VRPKAAQPVEEAEGGFTIQVRAVAGAIWTLPGTSREHTVGELKQRLVTEDARFRNNRADLVVGSKVLGDAETLRECNVGPGARLVAVFSDLRAAVLVVGGGAAGRTAVQELSPAFQDQWIILVDPQEYFEHPCGIFRAYADPASWEALVVPFEDAVSRYSNVQFIQGEVKSLRPGSATVASAGDGTEFTVRFGYCVVATGCNFAPSCSTGQSLWRPTSLSEARRATPWPALDERTVAGRRRRVVEENRRLWALHDRGAAVLVVGADYQGVQWACDLRHHFPNLAITLVDSLPRCLSTLPPSAAEYAQDYMQGKGIRTFYDVKYDPESDAFWERVNLPGRADVTYVLQGVASRNAFMPLTTVSSRGPGSGGWIVTNTHLHVCLRGHGDRPAQVWAGGRVFAVGDCQYGAVASKAQKPPGRLGASADVLDSFAIPPVPKTTFAAVSWAKLACRNILATHSGWPLESARWPSEAGIVAVSLGLDDALVCWKVRCLRDSGEVVLCGEAAVEMKRRLTWPDDREWLVNPAKWLATFQEGIPAGRLLSEQGRSALRLSSRAW